MALANDVATTTQILQASPVTHDMAIQAASNLVQSATQISTATAGAAGSTSAATAAAATISSAASVSSSFTVAAAITSVVAATAAVTVGVTNVLDVNTSSSNSTLTSLITPVPTLTPTECSAGNKEFNSYFQMHLNRGLRQQEIDAFESTAKDLYNGLTGGGCDDLYNREARDFDIFKEENAIRNKTLITVITGNITGSCTGCKDSFFGPPDTSNRQLVQEVEGENEVDEDGLFDQFIEKLKKSFVDIFPFDDNVQLSLFSERSDINSTENFREYQVDRDDIVDTPPIPLCDGKVDIHNGSLVLHLAYLDRMPEDDERESLATTIKTIYDSIMGTDNCSNSTNNVGASGDLFKNKTTSSAARNVTIPRNRIVLPEIGFDDTNNSIVANNLNILPTVKMLVTSPVVCFGCNASIPFFSTSADAAKCTIDNGSGNCEKEFTEFVTVLKAEMGTIFPTQRVEIALIAEIVQPNNDPISSQAPMGLYMNFTSTLLPSEQPTQLPSTAPSLFPSQSPSVAVSNTPSISPSVLPSFKPSKSHSQMPSTYPTDFPTVYPTGLPSVIPSDHPSRSPSTSPSVLSDSPTYTTIPSEQPSELPSTVPSLLPSESPSAIVSNKPSASTSPTVSPTSIPSENPSGYPSWSPSTNPSVYPSTNPSLIPTMTPTLTPTCDPSTLEVVDITEANDTHTCSQQYDDNPIIVKELIKDYQNEGSDCISFGFNQTLRTNGNLQFVILEFLSHQSTSNPPPGSSSCLLIQAIASHEILWIDECVQCVDGFAEVSVYGRDNNWYLNGDTALLPDRCGSQLDPSTRFSCAWKFNIPCIC